MSSDAESMTLEQIVQMLRNRICFDNLQGLGCEHQLCYGLENLIWDINNGVRK